MNKLALRLASHEDSPIHWLLWSSDENEIIASGILSNAAALSELAGHAANAKVIAFAASQAIAFHQVSLPTKANRKLLSAIPYMLEDELVGDLNEQFFAFGKNYGLEQEVAVVSQSQMTTWLSWLQTADLVCEYLYPDVLCLPWEANQVSILGLEPDILCRSGEFSGVQGNAAFIRWLCKDKLSESQHVLALSELDSEITECFAQYSEQLAQLPLLVMLEQAEQAPPLNLFQQVFSQRKKSHNHWQNWRLAAGLAGLALVVNLIAKHVELNDIEAQRAQIKTQIEANIKQGFGNIGKVVSPRRVLPRELQKLEQGAGGISMLVMLNQLSQAFVSSGVTPQSLRFDATRSEIRMQSQAKNFEALEKFRREAQALGFDVDQGAINNKGDLVTGAMVIRG